MAILDPSTLWRRLGHPGGPPERVVSIELLDATQEDGFEIRRLLLAAGTLRIPAILLVPDNACPARPAPAILYCHAHGNRYDIGKSEVLEGRPALMDPALGAELARQGYVVLCPDMTGFGARQAEGTESALAKVALWQGRSLLGDMLCDLALAHRALCDMPEVAGGRMATLGISMGATLAYFFAALTPSVACTAHLCAFSAIAGLIETGAHDLHGVYMVVPGLLPEHDMPDVAALVAPRPQLICSGGADPLTPDHALAPALSHLQSAYRAAGAEANLRILSDPLTGHSETPRFRSAVLGFLRETIGQAP